MANIVSGNTNYNDNLMMFQGERIVGQFWQLNLVLTPLSSRFPAAKSRINSASNITFKCPLVGIEYMQQILNVRIRQYFEL